MTEVRVITTLNAKREAKIRAAEARLTRDDDASQSWDRLKLVSLLLAA